MASMLASLTTSWSMAGPCAACMSCLRGQRNPDAQHARRPAVSAEPHASHAAGLPPDNTVLRCAAQACAERPCCCPAAHGRRACCARHVRDVRCAAQVAPLYLAAMDAIHAVSPSTTFLVEGTGQTAFPGINWGDGFVTDPALIKQYGLSDANLFFGPLLSKPYLNNVGVSPHVYPPSVTFQNTVRPPPPHGCLIHKGLRI